MQIDKGQLTELIADKTGMDKEQVEEQLNELIIKIREAVDKGQNFEIKGFGTFKVVDKELRFSPAPSLKTEINHKYAGMQPIELIGAFKDAPDTPVEKEEESEPELQKQEESIGIEQDQEEEVEIDTKEKKAPSFTFDADASETFEAEEEVLETEEAGIEETPSKPEPQPVMSGEEKKESSRSDDTKKKRKEESDPIGRFLVAAVIIVAIGVSGWFVYDFGLLDSVVGNSNSNNPKQTVQNAGKPTPEEESQPSTPGDKGKQESGSEQKKENGVSKSAGIAEESKGSMYGLRGGAVPEAQSGYTIVVHSLRDKAKAEAIKQDLSSEGYLTILTSGVVDGVTRWRVGLGQFKNLEDAKQAINDLPAPYKQDNFIRKF